MITTAVEETRFYTGDVVTYSNSSPAWLYEQAAHGEDLNLRSFAAAGLVRATLDIAVEDRHDDFVDQARWAGSVLLSVRQEAEIPEVEPNFIERLDPVSAKFDSISTVATEANRPSRFAEVLREYLGNDPFLVVGLGHGGTIAAVDTFAALDGEDNEYYPVRFSQYKFEDRQPQLTPTEINHLTTTAKERIMLVFDEDVNTGSTVRNVIDYFHNQLGLTNRICGAAPVISRHPGAFKPWLAGPRRTTIFNADWGFN